MTNNRAIAALSSFERIFEDWRPGHSIISSRADLFDLHHGLFYAPITYVEGEVSRPLKQAPNQAWIRQAFTDFVREEFGSTAATFSMLPTPIVSDPVDLIDISVRLRDRLESLLIYDADLEAITSSNWNDPLGRVYGLLTCEAFGRQVNSKNVTLEKFRESMKFPKVGCRLVVPGLPFRDQNPLRAENQASDITLAEIGFLLRLHCTALAIYQYLPTGSDIVVLSDGELYAPIFDVAIEEARLYLAGVREIRTRLNLGGTVSIVSLRKLIDLYDAGTGGFWAAQADIDHRLAEWLLDPPDPEFERQFGALARGMRWNLNSSKYEVSNEELFGWLSLGTSETGLLPANDEINRVARTYAATNLALRWHQVVGAMLPTAVRATMHPKPGQIALPRLGSCFPWNGVAIITGDHELEVHSLVEASRRGLRLKGRIGDRGTIVYYEREE